MTRRITLTALFCLAIVSIAEAREFRALRRIQRAVAEELPEGAERVATPKPVSTDSVRTAVGMLTGEWNGGGMEGSLHENFYDRDRLLDKMDEDVPRDASLKVIGVRNPRTISQYRTQGAEPGVSVYTSRVSVTVHTQTRYNSPTQGFRKLDGVNEYILEITEEVRP